MTESPVPPDEPSPATAEAPPSSAGGSNTDLPPPEGNKEDPADVVISLSSSSTTKKDNGSTEKRPYAIARLSPPPMQPYKIVSPPSKNVVRSGVINYGPNPFKNFGRGLSLFFDPVSPYISKMTAKKVFRLYLGEETRVSLDADHLFLCAISNFLEVLIDEIEKMCSKENKTLIVYRHLENALRSLGNERFAKRAMELVMKSPGALASRTVHKKKRDPNFSINRIFDSLSQSPATPSPIFEQSALWDDEKIDKNGNEGEGAILPAASEHQGGDGDDGSPRLSGDPKSDGGESSPPASKRTPPEGPEQRVTFPWPVEVPPTADNPLGLVDLGKGLSEVEEFELLMQGLRGRR